jgi:hypothetical protein
MGIKDSVYKWIYTNGGPLILISDKYLSFWKGTGSDLNNQPSGDYKRACEVSEWIGKLKVGDGECLIFGGDNYQASWKGMGVNSGIIVRWGSAENEDSVIASLEKIPDEVWIKEPFTYKVDGGLRLFDSAEDGEKADEFLSIILTQGEYEILTANYNPNPETELVLHKLQKLLNT